MYTHDGAKALEFATKTQKELGRRVWIEVDSEPDKASWYIVKVADRQYDEYDVCKLLNEIG